MLRYVFPIVFFLLLPRLCLPSLLLPLSPPSVTLLCLTCMDLNASFLSLVCWPDLCGSIQCPVILLPWLSSSAGLDLFPWLDGLLVPTLLNRWLELLSRSTASPVLTGTAVSGLEDSSGGEAADCSRLKCRDARGEQHIPIQQLR